MASDPREARLPKWAQEELASLRRDLESVRNYSAELRGLRAGTNTFVQNYLHGDYGLPNDARITFHLTPESGHVRRSVKAYVEDGRLYLQGDYSLAVLPEASNCLRVEFRERW